MKSVKKMHEKAEALNQKTEPEKNARLEYASLYDDDAGPTEEEKLQMQLEAKEAENYRKGILFHQHLIRSLSATAALVFGAIIIYSFHNYKNKTEITPATIAGTSESVIMNASKSLSANQAATADTTLSVSAKSPVPSSASVFSSADILSGISQGDYHIYDPNASYQKVKETVTSSGESVNLRTVPSIEEGSAIITNIQKGQVLTRIGIGENGWSELSYKGKTVYAVTGLLSTYEDSASAAVTGTTVSDAASTASSEVAKAPAVETPAAPAAQASVSHAVPQKTSSQTARKEYTIQTSTDSKTSSIWEKGKRMGSMNITNADGVTEKMLIYDSYYYDKEGRKYLNIYIKDNTSDYSINADSGYIDAMNEMNCSGICLNKSVHTW